MKLVFQKDQEFYSSSHIGNDPSRLNARYEIFLRPVEDEIRGARVLDLACHNGRWTYAALQAGAEHVTGVEHDAAYVDSAREILAESFPEDAYDLHTADLLDYLCETREQFDVVFCLGFLYHTIHQVEVLRRIRRLEPKLLIVDCSVYDTTDRETLYGALRIPKPLRYIRNTSQRENAFAVTGRLRNRHWETVPSQRQLEIWMEATGFDHQYLEVPPGAFPAGTSDYEAGLRVAYHCRPI